MANHTLPQFCGSVTFDISRYLNLVPALNAQIQTHFLPASARPPPLPFANMASAIFSVPAPPDIPDTGRYTQLTYLPFLLKTLSKTMDQWPLFKATLEPYQDPLPGTPAPPRKLTAVREGTDITLAMSTPTGIYTPTLLDVSSQSIYMLQSRLSHISHLARQTPSPSPELFSEEISPKKGGTIMVSTASVGLVDSLLDDERLVSIALGEVKWVQDMDDIQGEGPKLKFEIQVSWSAHHKVVDIADMGGFIACWRKYTEFPEWIFGEALKT